MNSAENKFRLPLQRILSGGLGGLLIAASLLTVWSESRNPSPANRTWVHRPVAMMPVAVIEAVLGTLLMAGLYRYLSWMIAIGVFGVFAIITAIEAASGEDSCNCLGAISVRPVYTMFLDVVAVAALLWTGSPPSRGIGQSIPRRWTIAGAVALLWLPAVTAFWITKPAIAVGHAFGKTGDSIILEPSKWVGQPVSLAQHIDIGSQLQTGQWIVLLVRHDCRHCAGAVQRYISSFSAGQHRARLAVIEMAPYSDADDPAFWELPKSVLSGRLDESRDWVVTTPVAVGVSDGIVISGAEGDAAENPDSHWFAD
jgi:hypothetical protein